MKKSCITLVMLYCLLSLSCVLIHAEEALQPPTEAGEPVITVEEGAIATGVENRLPTGVAERFPATVSTLYCFTKVTIKHQFSCLQSVACLSRLICSIKNIS